MQSQGDPQGSGPIPEQPVTEQQLRQMLSNGIVHIKFDKADGTPREMYATTVSSMMPDTKKPKQPKTQSGDLVHVFDLELQDWRALKVSKVREVEHVSLPWWLSIKRNNGEKQ